MKRKLSYLTVRCMWGVIRTKQKEKGEEKKKKEGKTNMNIGGSDISLFLAQSHIDSLHSTEPLGYYSHTGLDNFTHLKLAHPFPIFLVCPAVSHTAAPGAPTMLKLALPSGIKKEGECSKPCRNSGKTACNSCCQHIHGMQCTPRASNTLQRI